MRIDGYDEEIVDEDQVIDEFLGENPRARELRLMRMALEQRRDGFRREQQQARDEHTKTSLAAKLHELDRQIAALRQEEEITSFVEGSVRVTLNRPTQEDLEF